jgi:dual specificity protein kinase YAK1
LKLIFFRSSPKAGADSAVVNLRNRYLILDVLGQGTFGQVVKCQNLKTQEVVAVKVVKNRTAYFNQSMMEVSVLDLVIVAIQ